MHQDHYDSSLIPCFIMNCRVTCMRHVILQIKEETTITTHTAANGNTFIPPRLPANGLSPKPRLWELHANALRLQARPPSSGSRNRYHSLRHEVKCYFPVQTPVRSLGPAAQRVIASIIISLCIGQSKFQVN